jgi:hypothetical protein
MAKRLTDDEIMDYSFNKLFGDLDGIRSGSMFGQEESDVQGAAPNAGTPGIEGIDISIKPRMTGAQESAKPDDIKGPADDEDDKDNLKGIGKMSPLMAQLHGER